VVRIPSRELPRKKIFQLSSTNQDQVSRRGGRVAKGKSRTVLIRTFRKLGLQTAARRDEGVENEKNKIVRGQKEPNYL